MGALLVALALAGPAAAQAHPPEPASGVRTVVLGDTTLHLPTWTDRRAQGWGVVGPPKRPKDGGTPPDPNAVIERCTALDFRLDRGWDETTDVLREANYFASGMRVLCRPVPQELAGQPVVVHPGRMAAIASPFPDLAPGEIRRWRSSQWILRPAHPRVSPNRQITIECISLNSLHLTCDAYFWLSDELLTWVSFKGGTCRTCLPEARWGELYDTVQRFFDYLKEPKS